MNKYSIIAVFLILTILLSACSQTLPEMKEQSTNSENSITTENPSAPNTSIGSNSFPEEVVSIPDEYMNKAQSQGKLEYLYYDTYESFSYEEKSQKLTKRALVYLPYDMIRQKNTLYFTLCMAAGVTKQFIWVRRKVQEI